MSGHFVFQGSAHSCGTHVRTSPIWGCNSIVVIAILAIVSMIFCMTARAQTTSYTQTNIISNQPGTASVTDPTLINPWGVSVGPAIWIDAAGSGVVKVDTSAGASVIPDVTIPAASTNATHGFPSGTVYNTAGTGFNLPNNSPALFLFATLDGTIAGWNSASGTQAVTIVNNSATQASYTGIALDTNSTGTFLLAADFAHGTVGVFNSSFASATLSGSFVDPSLPAGYSPFDIHVIGGNVYITYAKVNPSNGGFVSGAGLGYVDEFDSNGNFITEAITQSVLNAPWGMALAPQGFGSFGGDLLVANFGDGVINAFNPTTFAFVGSLNTTEGTPIANPGLWEIFFGQGGTLGDPNTLYFAAGINNEQDGLFGSIGVVQPAGGPNFTLSASSTSLTIGAGQSSSLMLSITPTNGFNGQVTLSCTSPTVSCTFNSSTVSLSGTSPISVSVSVSNSAPPPPAPSPYGEQHAMAVHSGHTSTGIALLALIGPLGLLSFAGLRRRSILARGSLLALLLLVAAAGITGCSSSSPAAMATAPVNSTLTITATSGAITQSVTIPVTLQ